MPNIDLSILNQRQTPAFYADVFANRPAAGYVGRIFVSTDTFAFYRDNGTSWDLIGGPGTGTVTGTGANGQVTFWNGASTITGSNDLFWDATNGHLGVNTNAPGTALDVHHDQNTVAILNQTTATNDVRIGFQNNGVGLWRIGAFYNAGANDFGIFDAVGNIQPVTVKKTTGQVLIGTSTVGSGKLVVASSTGDNGVQIVGASAPSLRIDNAESGPTKRAGFGISTATNNFIQGSADRDFCMFNGSTTASPILFGIYGTTNVQEAARISAARNLLVGTTTDGGQRLQISGSARATSYYLDGMTAGNGILYYSGARLTLANYNVGGQLTFEVNGGVTAATILSNENFGIGITTPEQKLTVIGLITASQGSAANRQVVEMSTSGTTAFIGASYLGSSTFGNLELRTSGTAALTIGTTGAATFSSTIRSNNTSGFAIGDLASYRRIQYDNSITTFGFLRDDNGLANIQGQAATFSNGTSGINQLLTLANPSGAVGDQGSIIRFTGFSNSILSEIRGLGRPANTSAGRLQFFVSDSSGIAQNRMSISESGNILIDTTTDTGQKLQVNGNIVSQSTSNPFFGSQRNGGNQYGFYSDGAGSLILVDFGVAVRGNFNMGTGVYTATSDINKKKDFELSNLGLDAILGLKPTLYRMKEDKENTNKYLGFIAQEVKEFIPQSFVEKEDFIGLDYQPIIATLVKAIQELNTKIENLKN